MSKFNLLLANYLNIIEHELRDLPAPARENEIREIESHLHALIQAEQQLEATNEADATEIALRQFGAPRQIGRKLRKAWERARPEAGWRVTLASVAIGIALNLVTPFYEIFANFAVSVQPVSSLNPIAFWSLALPAVSILPFLWGFVAGLISPKRGQLATLIASVLLSLAWFSPLFSLRHLPNLLSLDLLIFFAAMLGAHCGARRGRKLSALISRTR